MVGPGYPLQQQREPRGIRVRHAGKVDLDDATFGIQPNVPVMHQVVTAQLAAARAELLRERLLALVGCLSPERGRDLRCSNIEHGARARAVCEAAQQNLRLWLYGRPFPTPGFLLGEFAVREVYCQLDIDTADLPVLRRLRDDPTVDGRVHLMATHLVALLEEDGSRAGSRYDSSSPHYLLRGGCDEP